LGAYGRLMFIAGEAMLTVTTDGDTGLEKWEMLSTDELRLQGNTYLRVAAPSLPARVYHDPTANDGLAPLQPDEAIVYRIWQRHPRYSALADSTMMGVL